MKMTMINTLLANLDVYTLRARVYPGLLAFALPVAVLGVVLFPLQPALAIAPVAAAMGLMFFVSTFTRDRGKRLEEKLVVEWQGLPTTRMLRHRQVQNSTLFQRRRDALQALTGITLPTKRQEQANPDAADDVYIAATRHLINRVRDAKDQFPRVFEENVSYGFARNLLALKPIALTVLVLVVSGVGVLMWRTGISPEGICVLSIELVAAAMWIFFVRPRWVHRAGQSYAERLFDALDILHTRGAADLPNQRPTTDDPVGTP